MTKTQLKKLMANLVSIDEALEMRRGDHDEMTGMEEFTVKTVNAKRREAAALGWVDPTIRAARMTKHAVECDGVYYTSLAQAFKAHDLPMSKFHKFRLDLKAYGEQVGWKHDFVLVPVRKTA